MGMVNVFRYFDQTARPYERVASRLLKSVATKRANKVRKSGGKARVIKEADGYALFTLVKGKRGVG